MEKLIILLDKSYDLEKQEPTKSAYWHLSKLRSEIKKLTLTDVSQSKRTVCPKCGDYGWIYNEDSTSRRVCPCHY